jgi:RNA polymerase sigma factor (sigma-70 family)
MPWRSIAGQYLAKRLAQLLDEHGRGLHALLLRLTLNREAAAELFQELFARLAGSKGFLTSADAAAFAFRSAINLAHDWRRRRRHVPTVTALPDQLPSPNDASVGQIDPDELNLVLAAISELGEPARTTVCLRYLQQMSFDDVGRVIGRSAHQARALCHAAIVRLRHDLRERQVDHVER